MDEIKYGSVDFNEIIRKIAKDEHFTNYKVNIEQQKAFTGDNFCSKNANAQIIEEDGDEKQVSLFFKLADSTEEERTKFPVGEFFKREVAAYNIVLPQLMKFREMHKVEEFFKYPKCYQASDTFMEEYLILEDLCKKGYKLYGKIVQLDYEHSQYMLHALANYHAISFAMSAKNPIGHARLRSHVSFEFNYPNYTWKMLTNIMGKITPHIKDENRRNAITGFVNKSKEYFDYCLNAMTTAPYNVICHGDCWNNNILYKNKDGDIEGVFLDFQFIRYASPATDIVYLFSISSNKTFRDENLSKLCDEYYHKLDENLKLYGCDIKEIYPREIFDKHLVDVLPFGILFGLLTASLVYGKPGEEKKLEDLLQDDISAVTFSVTDEMLQRLDEFADDIIKHKFHI